MASNPFQRRDRELERTLQRLEKTYDKDSAHHREYHGALADIRDLLAARKIDSAHAIYLREAAKAKFDAAAAAQRMTRREADEAAFVKRWTGLVWLVLLLLCAAVFFWVLSW